MANNNFHHKFYSPLRYPGGKGCIFPFVSRVFYENRLIGSSYAEPYAGGAGLALRLLFEEYVENIYINDLDRSIFSFWNVVVNDTVRFCDWLEDVNVTVDNWFYYREIQNDASNQNEIELAKSTFFLNRTNVSGVIKGGLIGGQTQKGKYKIDARFNKNDLLNRIARISRFRNRISVSCNDGLKFITRMNNRREELFIYIDPPYYQKGADLYMNFYREKDHKKLAKRVHLIKKKWMISYDNSKFILGLYPHNRKVLYKLSQSASNRVGDEVFVFDDTMDIKKSISVLNSPISI